MPRLWRRDGAAVGRAGTVPACGFGGCRRPRRRSRCAAVAVAGRRGGRAGAPNPRLPVLPTRRSTATPRKGWRRVGVGRRVALLRVAACPARGGPTRPRFFRRLAAVATAPRERPTLAKQCPAETPAACLLFRRRRGPAIIVRRGRWRPAMLRGGRPRLHSSDGKREGGELPSWGIQPVSCVGNHGRVPTRRLPGGGRGAGRGAGDSSFATCGASDGPPPFPPPPLCVGGRTAATTSAEPPPAADAPRQPSHPPTPSRPPTWLSLSMGAAAMAAAAAGARTKTPDFGAPHWGGRWSVRWRRARRRGRPAAAAPTATMTPPDCIRQRQQRPRRFRHGDRPCGHSVWPPRATLCARLPPQPWRLFRCEVPRW